MGTVKKLPDRQNFMHPNQFGSLFFFYFPFVVNAYDIGHGAPLALDRKKLRGTIPSGSGGVNLLPAALAGQDIVFGEGDGGLRVSVTCCALFRVLL